MSVGVGELFDTVCLKRHEGTAFNQEWMKDMDVKMRDEITENFILLQYF